MQPVLLTEGLVVVCLRSAGVLLGLICPLHLACLQGPGACRPCLPRVCRLCAGAAAQPTDRDCAGGRIVRSCEVTSEVQDGLQHADAHASPIWCATSKTALRYLQGCPKISRQAACPRFFLQGPGGSVCGCRGCGALTMRSPGVCVCVCVHFFLCVAIDVCCSSHCKRAGQTTGQKLDH